MPLRTETLLFDLNNKRMMPNIQSFIYWFSRPVAIHANFRLIPNFNYFYPRYTVNTNSEKSVLKFTDCKLVIINDCMN